MGKYNVYNLRIEETMPAVKIGHKHQVTIPKEIFEKLHLQPGEWVEAFAQDGKIVFIPKQLTDKPPVPKLSKAEQQILANAKEKIAKIRADLAHSIGLNDKELKLAVKVGLIDADQTWWWHEGWQKGEREAEKDLAEGRYKKFDNVEDLIKELNS